MAGISAPRTRGHRRLRSISEIPVGIRPKLERANFVRCRDVAHTSELDLVCQLDVTLAEARALLLAVARAVCPKRRTALSLLGEEAGIEPSSRVPPSRQAPRLLPTGFVPLDLHFGGGLRTGAICELVGPAGVGKTQLCLSIAAHALLSGETRVLYVDTEGSFSPERLVQLLTHKQIADGHNSGGGAWQDAVGLTAAAERTASRLLVFKPTTWGAYTNCLDDQVEKELLQAPPVALLIVDSIASAVSRQHPGEAHKRQLTMASQANRLKFYADTFGCAVLAVNQVTAAGGQTVHGSHVAEGDGDHGLLGLQGVHGHDDVQLVAQSGPMWAHCVNTRLVLQYPAIGEVVPAPLRAPPAPGAVHAAVPKPMRLRVAKSAMCAEATFGYVVDVDGIRSVCHTSQTLS